MDLEGGQYYLGNACFEETYKYNKDFDWAQIQEWRCFLMFTGLVKWTMITRNIQKEKAE